MRNEIGRSLIKMFEEKYWHFILFTPLKINILKSLEKRVIRMRRNGGGQSMTVFITSVESCNSTPFNKLPENYIQMCFKWFEHDHFQEEIAEDSSVLSYIDVQYFTKTEEMLLKLEYDL